MEIKINKEICAYHETLFFGLSARQFLCSVLAVAIAVGIYFFSKGLIGKETASWVCMIGAAPVAAMGFFKYNGLTAEKLAWAFLKSTVFYRGRRVYKADHYYLDLLTMEPKKEVLQGVKNIKEQYRKRKRSLFHSQKRTGIHSHRKDL